MEDVDDDVIVCDEAPPARVKTEADIEISTGHAAEAKMAASQDERAQENTADTATARTITSHNAGVRIKTEPGEERNNTTNFLYPVTPSEMSQLLLELGQILPNTEDSAPSIPAASSTDSGTEYGEPVLKPTASPPAEQSTTYGSGDTARQPTATSAPAEQGANPEFVHPGSPFTISGSDAFCVTGNSQTGNRRATTRPEVTAQGTDATLQAPTLRQVWRLAEQISHAVFPPSNGHGSNGHALSPDAAHVVADDGTMVTADVQDRPADVSEQLRQPDGFRRNVHKLLSFIGDQLVLAFPDLGPVEEIEDDVRRIMRSLSLSCE